MTNPEALSICRLCNKPIHGLLYATSRGFSHITCLDAKRFLKSTKKARKAAKKSSKESDT